ncbi:MULTISPECIES: NnrS family protein [Rhodopseudomonas]|uniref:Short-chain dehydrogenase n=1 Tax=Rhodopseudomonas palustris TaxID=1076 RepID=A0A0D7EK16_RHOPL|nr:MULTISPECIES: NnrS family protein [Rhodopseudomonas]KIZ39802.1 short-chain dehydrogenase [Rhodopseudomonas palustris]MDF3813211.1 NnrS family protein [Rhodopseudomonas sp. BAL398]WOK17829.1 NnrS family protein [Rhodopseudomonas sp. BAL398]
MTATIATQSAPPEAKRIPVPRFRPHHGWTILSTGFRPFFLLGATFAALAVLIWLPFFHGEVTLATAMAPRDWHVHEMLYGYLPAVITGFLFTAIPNWTGRLPIQGTPLLTLVIVWLAGRFALAFSADIGWLAAMLIDCSFLLLVALAASREILAGRNWRNLNVVVLIALLLAGNVAFHLEAHVSGAADFGMRAGIAVVIVLIGLIGGRIIPSFTRNWLVRENPGRLPVPFNRFDIAIMAVSAMTLLVWVLRPQGVVTGALLALAGILHLVRLARWAGDRTSKERLVLVLHVGYAFVPLGFLLTSAAAFDLIPSSAGVHAWMVGAAGIMTLAVMSRATLGHSGQPLTATRATQAIYGGALVAVLARVCAVLQPAWSDALLHVAAFAWAAAFLGFAILFGRLLIGHGKPAR